MASRRAPPRNLPYDSTETTQTTNRDNAVEVAGVNEDAQPFVLPSNGPQNSQNTLNSRMASIRSRLVPHPKLSTFGPKTLEEFLRAELERQRCEQSTAEQDPETIDLRALRQKAMRLVKANTSLTLVEEEGRKEFKIEKVFPRQRRLRGRAHSIPGYDSETEASPSSLRRKRRTTGIKFTSGDLVSPTLKLQRGTRTTSSSKRKSTNTLNALSSPSELPYEEQPASNSGQETLLCGPTASFQSPTTRIAPLYHVAQPSSLPRRGQSQPATRQDVGNSAFSGYSKLFNTSDETEYSQPICAEEMLASSASTTGKVVLPHSHSRRHSQPIRRTEDVAWLSTSRRSLSFEKHANEQRKHRRSGSSASLLSSKELKGKDRVEDTPQRTRKAPSNQSLSSSHNRTSVSLQSSLRPGIGQSQSDLDSAVVNEETHRTSPNPASGSSNLVEPTEAEASESDGDNVDVLDFYREFAIPEEANHSRLDKDTFLTGSSDESESDPIPGTSFEEQLDSLIDEQRMILASVTETNGSVLKNNEPSSAQQLFQFDYSKLVPEQLPNNLHQADRNRRKIWQAHGLDDHGRPSDRPTAESDANIFPLDALDPKKANILSAPDELGNFERKWHHEEPLPAPESPPQCLPPLEPRTSLPAEIWEEGVLDYLSSSEVRNLRLVCKNIAIDLAPHVFRNVVTRFGRSMYNIHVDGTPKSLRDYPASGFMFDKYGKELNKFGIAFEMNEFGLAYAPNKVTEKLVHTWYGDYKWPVKDYPYFRSLKEMDDLLDDERQLLTQSLKKLTECSELGLCIDSGHGWLNGSDMSDLQLYQHLADGGSKVFGKTFAAEDGWHAFALREYFKWAQMNTINENLKHLHRIGDQYEEEEQILRNIVIRGYDSYLVQSRQPDFERYAHTGGKAGQGITFTNPQHNHNPAPQPAPAPAGHGNLYINGQPMPTVPPTNVPYSQAIGLRVAQIIAERQTMPEPDKPRKQDPIQPQWPVIFNGYNVSAESRGHNNHIQEKVAAPAANPLHPGQLKEAQAQWLLETSWVQRTFLSAYTDAVCLSSHALRGVHSLHISKMSSGLLQSLAQDAFWSSLPGLRKVTILVKPDWREEHIPGDKFWHRNMAIAPFEASLKFAQLLQSYIGRLENLYTLTVGFVGGGEHQSGLFGRNQHVLPAPITLDPFAWLTDHKTQPDRNTMFSFNHIRALKFENCWFSPAMLRAFMVKSRDTSLHHLILDSVSLTGINSSRTDGPLQTVLHNLKCDFSPSEWLQESVPISACWVNVLDSITPGKTLLDRKYDADMIDVNEQPKPESGFRGNIQCITLNSCGYVKISGVSSNDLNQNGVVVQNKSWTSLDEGLRVRMSGFHARTAPTTEPSDIVNVRRINQGNDINNLLNIRDATLNHIMLSGRGENTEGNANNAANQAERGERSVHNLYLLGRLTQCVHPVEKRILEHAWGMRFGWGDTMERWSAVEDGFFEGGTGRFSGEIRASDACDAAPPLSRTAQGRKVATSPAES